MLPHTITPSRSPLAKGREVPCHRCGKRHWRNPSKLTATPRYYCGLTCYNAARREQGPEWDAVREAKRRTMVQGQRNRGATNGMHGKVGPAATNWRGGITTRTRTAAHSTWSKDVMRRDDWTCHRCGARSAAGKPVHLNAHHRLPWSDFPERRYDVANGVTYCRPCHQQIHREGPRAWSRVSLCCVECGTTAIRHVAFGRCKTCDQRHRRKKMH